MIKLKNKGINIFKDQPACIDLKPREAIGHFHLYAWLLDVIGRYCMITPEFPTGNGQIDIHIKCNNKCAILEIKSFKDLRQIKLAKDQSKKYAAKLGYKKVTIVVFISDANKEILQQISSSDIIDGINVIVKAIGI